MDAIEIMTNEEVRDVTTEVVTGGSNTAIKVIAAMGAAGLVGFGVYKLVKLISAKHKAKKELSAAKDVYSDFDEDDEEDGLVDDED